jgi:hypothetical protein
MLVFFYIFFIVYLFCLGVYLFYSFFSYKFVVWIYDLNMLRFVLDFVKIYLFVNDLFNGSVLYFVNFTAELNVW